MRVASNVPAWSGRPASSFAARRTRRLGITSAGWGMLLSILAVSMGCAAQPPVPCAPLEATLPPPLPEWSQGTPAAASVVVKETWMLAPLVHEERIEAALLESFPGLVSFSRTLTTQRDGSSVLVMVVSHDPSEAWAQAMEGRGKLDDALERIDAAVARCDQIDFSMCDALDDAPCPQEQAYQRCLAAAYPTPDLYWAERCGAVRVELVSLHDDGRVSVVEKRVLHPHACDAYVEGGSLWLGDADDDGHQELAFTFSAAGEVSDMDASREHVFFYVFDLVTMNQQFSHVSETSEDYESVGMSSMEFEDVDGDGHRDLTMQHVKMTGYCEGSLSLGQPMEVVDDQAELYGDVPCSVALQRNVWRYEPNEDTWSARTPGP